MLKPESNSNSKKSENCIKYIKISCSKKTGHVHVYKWKIKKK